MHILSVEAVSKDYGLRPILENVSLGLDSQDRVGVVGVNGSGKSIFLRLISGAETPDAGRITFADGVTVGYLPQNPPYAADATVLEAVFAASDERMRLLLDYERACGELAAQGGDERRVLDRVSELGRLLEASQGGRQVQQAEAEEGVVLRQSLTLWHGMSISEGAAITICSPFTLLCPSPNSDTPERL